MSNSKKRKIVALNEDDELYEKGLVTLVEGIFIKIEKELTIEKDPFEKYFKQVHLRLFKEIKNYAARVINGKIAILSELNKEDTNK